MSDLIERQAAIDMLATMQGLCTSKVALIQNSKIWQQIKDLPSAQSEIIKCKDCKYFELDHFEKVDGFPIPIIVAHEICMKWGNGCRSNINGWCFMAERKINE